MNLRSKSLCVLLLSLSVSSCGGSSKSAAVADPTSPPANSDASEPSSALREINPLADRTFTLERAEGYTPVKGTTIRMEFTDTRVSFHAGCNTQTVIYRTEGSTLDVSLGGLATTMMACAPRHDAQDTWFREFLLARPTFHLEGTTLTLKGADATLTLVDQVASAANRPLVGQPWMINVLVSGDMASTVGSAKPSIQFQSDGRVLLNTGCNTGNGSYEVAGAQIKFGPMALTRRACFADDVTKTENHIQQVVSGGAVNYKIEATRLTLQRSDGIGFKAMVE